jgi:ribosome maturation factor RimP
MADMATIAGLIEPEVRRLGYDLVRVTMTGGTSDPTLQVMAERPDTRQLDLGDCERISRHLSELLDERDPIEGGYRLEVSSPGIDRPLTRLKDYSDWQGHEARLKLADAVDGAKQVSGTIAAVDGNIIRIASPRGERSIPFNSIASAKLILTDKLIQATAPLSTEGADTIKTEG